MIIAVLASGTVYRDEKRASDAIWRKYLNLILSARVLKIDARHGSLIQFNPTRTLSLRAITGCRRKL